MGLLIVILSLACCVLIAADRLLHINRVAVAIFAGAASWVLYICYGADFVATRHAGEYAEFLQGAAATSVAVKEFVAQNVFIKYLGRASEIVLFLLSTMAIVEILNSNGCFDFMARVLRTRSGRRMLWGLSAFTFLLSANIDNLSAAVLMLLVMRAMISTRSLRLYYGSAIVLAATCGGLLTVIGDTTGLLLWTSGIVTATHYTLHIALPCLVLWLVPTWWIGRSLPHDIRPERVALPFRGDDAWLPAWVRVLMLVVGLGGLWFTPTFHNITRLSPCLGALCVLAVLYVVNELANRKKAEVGDMVSRRIPRALQYEVLQMVLFVLGVMLAFGAVQETGLLDELWQRIVLAGLDNTLAFGCLTMAVSTVLDSFVSALAALSVNHGVGVNDMYWRLIAYCAASGGLLLPIGSLPGIALMKTEHVRAGWYFRNIGWKILVCALAGLAVLVAMA